MHQAMPSGGGKVLGLCEKVITATLSLTKAKGGRDRGEGQDQFSTRFLSRRRKKGPDHLMGGGRGPWGVAWESEQAEQLSYEELLSVLDCVGEVTVRCKHLLANLVE
jgi:hypothetical protein